MENEEAHMFLDTVGPLWGGWLTQTWSVVLDTLDSLWGGWLTQTWSVVLNTLNSLWGGWITQTWYIVLDTVGPLQYACKAASKWRFRDCTAALHHIRFPKELEYAGVLIYSRNDQLPAFQQCNRKSDAHQGGRLSQMVTGMERPHQPRAQRGVHTCLRQCCRFSRNIA